MTYDVFNRLTEVSEGGLVTKYAYDKNSCPISPPSGHLKIHKKEAKNVHLIL